MKRLITALTLAIIFQSCAPVSKLKLKGNYAKSTTYYFDKNENEVWSGLMEVICDKGFSVKSMEKSSGVIFGDKQDFSTVATAENSKGELVNKDAYIVTQHIYFTGRTYILPDQITADWNIRVFTYEGKTAMKINVKNIMSKSRLAQSVFYQAESTGNFEKFIADSIKF